MSKSRLDWALDLADRGFLILPLLEDSKLPISGFGWKSGATADHDIISDWLEKTNLNYGVCPGPTKAIIDLDAKDNQSGVTNFFRLEADQDFDDIISSTFTVKTASGGLHLYMNVPYEVGNSHSFPENIDVRGVHGYVVGPGCEFKGNPYYVTQNVEIQEAPDWVMTRMKKPGERDENPTEPLFELDTQSAINRALEHLSKRAGALEGYGGNDHTYATAALLKDLGISEDKCLDLLLIPHGWNSRCEPPWDVGELALIITNAYKYGQKQPGSKGAGTASEMFGTVDAEEDAEVYQEDRFANIRKLMFKGDLLSKRKEKREMIIPGWLPAHGFTAFLAQRGGGKTTIMFDMAMRIACNMDWHDLPIAENRTAVYLCGEDDVGIQEQQKAWIMRHQEIPDPDRFMAFVGIVDLMSMDSTKMWTEFLMEEVKDKKVVLFLDTWQRASSRGGQNNDEDMQNAVHHVEAMCKSLNGPGVVAFHPPKHDAGVILGHSVIENSTTAIWTLSDHATGKRLDVTRIKGTRDGSYQSFHFEEIKLGEYDEFGNENSSIVPVKNGGSSDGPTDPGISVSRAAAYAVTIRELDKYRLDPEYGDPEKYAKPFSLAALSSRIEQLAGQARGTDDLGVWADEVLGWLKAVGITAFKQRTIRNHLEELFSGSDILFDYGDGKALLLEKDGNAKRFVIGKSEL